MLARTRNDPRREVDAGPKVNEAGKSSASLITVEVTEPVLQDTADRDRVTEVVLVGWESSWNTKGVSGRAFPGIYSAMPG